MIKSNESSGSADKVGKLTIVADQVKKEDANVTRNQESTKHSIAPSKNEESRHSRFNENFSSVVNEPSESKFNRLQSEDEEENKQINSNQNISLHTDSFSV